MKPVLKTKKITGTVINSYDLGTFLKELWNLQYDFTFDETYNDSYYRQMTVDTKETRDYFEEISRQEYEEMKKIGEIPIWNLQTLLFGLAVEGEIPFGEYFILVSW